MPPSSSPGAATSPSQPIAAGKALEPQREISLFRRMPVFAGPGLLVAVGYMDPGNWATDIEAGARFGYQLLFVILFSSLAAILLQTLAMRLGIATGRDLAQACRDHFGRRTGITLFALAEIAIIATDMAEVLGAALAFKLLFGFPLVIGILLTGFDTLIVLGLRGHGVRRIEAIVLGLVSTILLCFVIELAFVRPDVPAMLRGFVPSSSVLGQPGALFLAIGIVGATVMPHNLYLHSALVRDAAADADDGSRHQAVRRGTRDTVWSLSIAAAVQVAILLVAAGIFHDSGHSDIGDIEQAHRMLAPLTGATAAALLFAIALFASGQSSTFTGTIAGQIVLEGFLKLRLPLWQQRLLTRMLAILPAMIGVLLLGEGSVGELLVLSQVVLSVQLPFAILPLIRFTSDRKLMGAFVTPRPLAILAWAIFFLIGTANIWLVASMMIAMP
ncbi:divalent metal cation transporter [Sphingomonas oleivorans]|uniref:Divalent metal cation transporter MntH n=1 Tax=Sphingomonas oleivorans TaxID=1735121 RepID=A0A2T5FTR4_9SPHN|nr:Nramp family divalent metal transporter [Sphingomonas oleivorans]PTQ07446.1 divalent metal cation transporter [Sphingomonas oleivorans]